MKKDQNDNIIAFDQYKKTLSAPVRDIMKTIGEAVVNHPMIQEAFDGICEAIVENEIISDRSHLLIIGDSGCGKSTLCDLFAKKFQPETRAFQLGLQLNQVALMTSLSSPLTPRFMAKTLLRTLGYKGSLGGTSDALTDLLLTMLKQAGIQVIFLDETQHLQALGMNSSGYSHKLRESLDWIKSLINKSEVTFVLMGMPPLVELIQADEQMARRFSKTCYLKPFPMPTKKEEATGKDAAEKNAHEEDNPGDWLGEFVDTLLDIACQLPYFDDYEAFGDNTENANRVYLATAGTPARINSLVIAAVRQAYEAGDRRIGLEHFAKAYQPERIVRAQISRVMETSEHLANTMSRLVEGKTLNPFELDGADLFSLSHGGLA
jgi:type II secretory pathway predicted ATPase ExeA